MKALTYRILFLFVPILVISVSCSKEDDPDDPPNPGQLTVNLGANKIIPEGDSAVLNAGNPGCTYLWSTGQTTQTIVADTTGTFWVKVTKDNSTGSDTIAIALAYKLPQIETAFGNFLIWLYPQTPRHRSNFIKLTEEKFYDSLIFHRVINDFVIQGGDPTGTGSGGPGYTIPAEILPNFKHVYGAVGAARLADNVNPEKKSSGSQFYIVDNVNGTPNLDGRYTVFGIIIAGLTTIDAISEVPTNLANDRPLENVYMKKVSIIPFTADDLKAEYGFSIP